MLFILETTIARKFVLKITEDGENITEQLLDLGKIQRFVIRLLEGEDPPVKLPEGKIKHVNESVTDVAVLVWSFKKHTMCSDANYEHFEGVKLSNRPFEYTEFLKANIY